MENITGTPLQPDTVTPIRKLKRIYGFFDMFSLWKDNNGNMFIAVFVEMNSQSKTVRHMAAQTDTDTFNQFTDEEIPIKDVFTHTGNILCIDTMYTHNGKRTYVTDKDNTTISVLRVRPDDIPDKYKKDIYDDKEYCDEYS